MLYVLNFKKLVAHMFIHSICYAPNIGNEAVYKFIEETINEQLSDHLSDQHIFKLIKTHQMNAHSRTCLIYNKMNVASPILYTLLRRQLLQNFLILSLAMIKSKNF